MDRRYRKRMDRYWDKMKNYAQRNFENLEPTCWFDYWHCHIDWEGKGDKQTENRESSLVLGYEVLQMANNFKSHVSEPIQSWWFIHEKSCEDAVYLHSPNENGTPFPYDFKGVQWGQTNLTFLNKLVDITKYKMGTLNNEYGITYVVAPIE